MSISSTLKKGSVVVILLVLVLVEVSLLVEFLPYRGRHAIYQRAGRIFPTGTYAPHPDMDWEFELDFRQHPWHRAVSYGALGLLVLMDTLLSLSSGGDLLGFNLRLDSAKRLEA